MALSWPRVPVLRPASAWRAVSRQERVRAQAQAQAGQGLSPQGALPEPDRSNPEWTLRPVRYAKPRTEGR